MSLIARSLQQVNTCTYTYMHVCISSANRQNQPWVCFTKLIAKCESLHVLPEQGFDLLMFLIKLPSRHISLNFMCTCHNSRPHNLFHRAAKVPLPVASNCDLNPAQGRNGEKQRGSLIMYKVRNHFSIMCDNYVSPYLNQWVITCPLLELQGVQRQWEHCVIKARARGSREWMESSVGVTELRESGMPCRPATF